MGVIINDINLAYNVVNGVRTWYTGENDKGVKLSPLGRITQPIVSIGLDALPFFGKSAGSQLLQIGTTYSIDKAYQYLTTPQNK